MEPMDDKNGRTHEPSLRELTAELDGLRRETAARFDGLAKIMDERDRRYQERAESGKTAVDAALKAADTFNTATFAASEKAVAKSEINAEKWRDNANEWRGAMIDRETKFASRVEVDNEMKNVQKEIASLKETRSQTTGTSITWSHIAQIITLAIIAGTFLILILSRSKI